MSNKFSSSMTKALVILLNESNKCKWEDGWIPFYALLIRERTLFALKERKQVEYTHHDGVDKWKLTQDGNATARQIEEYV